MNSQGQRWITHAALIGAVAFFSFTFNQLPLALSSRPDSIGADGDSGAHVAIQMKLRNPDRFPKDAEISSGREISAIYRHARPAFELIVHRTVGLVADAIFGGNIFAANIAVFWMYHLLFIIGCYALGLHVVRSPTGGAFFALFSVTLSLALHSWWGMVYAAVLPKDIGAAMVPWLMLGYLRWADHPRRLAVLFFLLGLAVNLYPFPPAFLALIMLGVMLSQRPLPLRHVGTLAALFLAGALPSIWFSAVAAWQRQLAVTPADAAVVDALFQEHFGYLLTSNPLTMARQIAAAPVWKFLFVAVIALVWKRHARALTPTDRRLATFTVWTAALAVLGMIWGGWYRPLVLLYFHRASALLYLPAYLGIIGLALAAWRRRPVAGKIAGIALLTLVLGFKSRTTALGQELRGITPPQATAPYHELAEWAARQTSPDSLFMVPYRGRASYYAFRAYAARGVLTQHGMGDIVLTYPAYARRFWQISRDVAPLYQQPAATADFLRAAQRYDVDYIVVELPMPQELSLPVAFRNEAFTVYAVPDGPLNGG